MRACSPIFASYLQEGPVEQNRENIKPNIQSSQTIPSQATPFGHSRTTRTTYTKTDHYYSRNHLAYYQPNVFHYQSTPWHYRWGRSTDVAAREKRAAKLVEVGDLTSIPVGKISDVASNVSIAYNQDIWQNDMIYKDQVRNTALIKENVQLSGRLLQATPV